MQCESLFSRAQVKIRALRVIQTHDTRELETRGGRGSPIATVIRETEVIGAKSFPRICWSIPTCLEF